MLSTGLFTAALGICTTLTLIAAVLAIRAAERGVHQAAELRLALAACKAAELQLRTAIGKCDELDGKVASLRGLVYRGRRDLYAVTGLEPPPDPSAAPSAPQSASDDPDFQAMLGLQSAPAARPGS